MSTVAILQSNYIPWKGYFDLIARADVFVIYDEVQYTKNDWRNRNRIKTPTGPRWLTIPVRKMGLGAKISEMGIATPDWHQAHAATLRQCYARAPYFSAYWERLERVYREPPQLLSQLNQRLIREVCEMLGIGTRIIDSRELELEGDRNGRLLDACMKLGATSYVSGPAAKGYLDEPAFAARGIGVEWMEYGDYPTYPQLFPPFEHGVSVLDLIFNTGPAAATFMKHVRP